ncbi:MAG: DUF2225 domain-containing protein [Planctomycetes bacterium]|nr:DUF2225 domain-containing protein [Planctomycetota bacterium]
MCLSRLSGREVGGGFALGQDSDLLVRMKGKHIIQAEIHSCQTCRFSGFARDFSINSTPEMGVEFRTRVTPLLATAPSVPPAAPFPDIQYYWAYHSADFLKRPSLALGLLLLRAYWCLRLPPTSNLPATELDMRRERYLPACVEHLRQSLRGSRNPHLYYLLGELCRRLEMFEDSVAYFEKFLRRPAAARYLQLATLKLMAAARERDGRERTMEEILYDHKSKEFYDSLSE